MVCDPYTLATTPCRRVTLPHGSNRLRAGPSAPLGFSGIGHHGQIHVPPEQTPDPSQASPDVQASPSSQPVVAGRSDHIVVEVAATQPWQSLTGLKAASA
jgi:hypothetical protein